MTAKATSTLQAEFVVFLENVYKDQPVMTATQRTQLERAFISGALIMFTKLMMDDDLTEGEVKKLHEELRTYGEAVRKEVDAIIEETARRMQSPDQSTSGPN